MKSYSIEDLVDGAIYNEDGLQGVKINGEFYVEKDDRIYFASEVDEVIMNMVDEFAETAKEYESDRAKDKEEIARLRKALDTLFSAATNVVKMVSDTYCSDERGPDDRCSLLENAIEFAREALAQGKEGK